MFSSFETMMKNYKKRCMFADVQIRAVYLIIALVFHYGHGTHPASRGVWDFIHSNSLINWYNNEPT